MSEGSKVRRRVGFAREVLLVEVERRCGDARCNARTRTGLTKEEARSYTGFECERCGRWNEDVLSERDIPEWWEELKITSLDGVRPVREQASAREETFEVVRRMSEAWRRRSEAGSMDGAGDAGGPGDAKGADDEGSDNPFGGEGSF